MTNTTEVILNDTTWVLVATGAASGFITNEGTIKVKYRENSALPVDAVGHTLEMDVGAYVSFSLTAGQNVYCKSTAGGAVVAVTLV